MNHFQLPRLPAGATPSPRFGSVAVPQLIEGLLAQGARRELLEAKVFGGARVLAHDDGLEHLGAKNVAAAIELLESQGVRSAPGDVLGHRGRRLIFDSCTGRVWVRQL